MANRKLRVLLKKIYSNGDKDTIFFKSRAKDVFIDEDGSTTLQDTVDKVNAMEDGATKVEDSATNGNIKINGTETNVYTHPNSGATAGTYNKVTVNAQGHVTSGSNVTDWEGTVSGDITNATATFTQASSRANITSGSTVSNILGKIAKYFADLKALAFVDSVGTANLDSTLTTAYNNRVTTDKVTTSTSITASGWVADARAIATLQNQINTINSNLSVISDKFTPNKTYITSVVQRVQDLNDYSASIINDIAYIINNQSILSGVIPCGNVTYSDAPENWNGYGFIQYNKHFDGYVSVVIYGEHLCAYMSYRKFNLNSMTWVEDSWQTIHAGVMEVNYCKKFIADASATASGGGFMFSETSYDTGMGSYGDGQLYFASNGERYDFDEMAKTLRYTPADGPVNLNSLTETGFHRFEGTVEITNGPSGISTLGDTTVFVTGPTHGFKLLVQSSGVYYQIIKWDGSILSWVKV